MKTSLRTDFPWVIFGALGLVLIGLTSYQTIKRSQSIPKPPVHLESAPTNAAANTPAVRIFDAIPESQWESVQFRNKGEPWMIVRTPAGTNETTKWLPERISIILLREPFTTVETDYDGRTQWVIRFKPSRPTPELEKP